MRWHSVTWSSDSARAAIFVSWRAAGRTRTNAATGSPRAAGSTPMLKPVITPVRCIRCTRSVTAGADMPTLRASADIVIRGSACSSRSSSRLVSSSWSRSDMRYRLRSEGDSECDTYKYDLQLPHHAMDDGAMATTTPPRQPGRDRRRPGGGRRDLPLPRAVVRGAPLRPPRRHGRRLAADGLGRAGARDDPPAVDRLARGRPRRAPARRRAGRRSRGHERHLLPRPRPAAARDRRRHRVPRRHRARGVRRAHPSQRVRARPHRRRRRAAHPGPPRRHPDRAAAGGGELPRLHALRARRPPARQRALGAPQRRPRPAQPRRGHRSGRRHPARHRRGPPGGPPPDLAALGARRRHLLDGDPLPHRPARDGPAPARDVQPHARAASGHRHGVRHRAAAPAARPPGPGRARAGRRRRRGPPSPGHHQARRPT